MPPVTSTQPTPTVPPVSMTAPTATVPPVTTTAPTATVPPVTTTAPTATVPPVTSTQPTPTVSLVTTTAPTATVSPVTTTAPTATVPPVTSTQPTPTVSLVTTTAPTATVPPVSTTMPTATVSPVTMTVPMYSYCVPSNYNCANSCNCMFLPSQIAAQLSGWQQPGSIVGIFIGILVVIATVILISVCVGVAIYAYRHPASRVGMYMIEVSVCLLPSLCIHVRIIGKHVRPHYKSFLHAAWSLCVISETCLRFVVFIPPLGQARKGRFRTNRIDTYDVKNEKLTTDE